MERERSSKRRGCHGRHVNELSLNKGRRSLECGEGRRRVYWRVERANEEWRERERERERQREGVRVDRQQRCNKKGRKEEERPVEALSGALECHQR